LQSQKTTSSELFNWNLEQWLKQPMTLAQVSAVLEWQIADALGSVNPQSELFQNFIQHYDNLRTQFGHNFVEIFFEFLLMKEDAEGSSDSLPSNRSIALLAQECLRFLANQPFFPTTSQEQTLHKYTQATQIYSTPIKEFHPAVLKKTLLLPPLRDDELDQVMIAALNYNSQRFLGITQVVPEVLARTLGVEPTKVAQPSVGNTFTLKK
jgi:hypothetical protein